MHAKDLPAKDLPATDIRALRVALAITWAVYRLERLPRNENGNLFPKTGNVFPAPPTRACAALITPWLRYAKIFGQGLDEQLRCREHNPRHEQGRARKQQEIVEDSGHHIPHAHCPMHRRRARTGRRRDGDTSNLAHNARRFDWFPTRRFFWGPYVFVLFLPRLRRCIRDKAAYFVSYQTSLPGGGLLMISTSTLDRFNAFRNLAVLRAPQTPR
jgi:hypothetical protein